MKKTYFLFGLSLLTLGATTSCGDFLDEYSQDLVVAKSLNDLNELLIGDVYLRSHEVSNGATAGTCGFFNILDDDVNTAAKDDGQNASTAWRKTLVPMFGYYAWQQDVRFNYGASNKVEDNTTWNTLYTRINHANNILDIIDDMPCNTDEEKALYHRVKGETHFLRAQFYLVLANLYGAAFSPTTADTSLCVPLKLSSYVEYDKDKETQFQRATVRTVFEQIAADLVQAETELTVSPQIQSRHLHRASWEAAALLLSRVYLNMQEWGKAAEAAQRVMQSTNYALAGWSDFKSNAPFLTQENREIIFSQGANFVAPKESRVSFSADPGDFCVTRELYDLYDSTDVRKQCFFSFNSVTDSVRLNNKYARGLTLNHISDGLALRFAEAYLNYAEACAMQRKETEANGALQQLRSQRHIGYEARSFTGEELVQEIRDERRRELCFEGHRWFDLRRYAVNLIYPYTKNILHVYNTFSDNNAFVASLYYLLPPGDPAYLFSLPKKVVEFDKVPMPDNLREKRTDVAIEEKDSVSLDDLLNPGSTHP